MTESEKKKHDCDCGCDECGDDCDCDFITLEFDDGQSQECEILGIFEVEGKEYIALLPTEEGSEDVYLYGYKEVGDDEFELIDIEDDAEFEKVSKEFEALTAEEE